MAAEQTCPQCGTVFTTRSHAPTTYCGYRCSAIARQTKIRGGPLPTKVCERCGVEFQKDPDWNLDHWKQRRFCSIKCRGNGRSRSVQRCAFCDREHVNTHGHLDRPYCSQVCYWLSLRTERYPVNRSRRHLAKLEFTHRQKTTLLKQADHRCQACGATENLECDHVIPIWNDGDNATSNGQVLCRPCHREKTNDDVQAYWKTLELARSAPSSS